MEWDMTSPAPLDAIDIVVPPYLKTLRVLHRLADVRTRLVQSQSIGYDGVAELLPPGVIFANAASVHETSAAELALAIILASQRGIPDFVRAAEQGRWAPSWRESLADRTVLLVGYGGVGKAVEERLRPFEVNVVRVAATERTDERGTVYATSALSQLLPIADIVVVSVPLNEETTQLVVEATSPGPRRDRARALTRRSPALRSLQRAHHATRGRCDVGDAASDGSLVERTDHTDGTRRGAAQRRHPYLTRSTERLLAARDFQSVAPVALR